VKWILSIGVGPALVTCGVAASEIIVGEVPKSDTRRSIVNVDKRGEGPGNRVNVVPRDSVKNIEVSGEKAWRDAPSAPELLEKAEETTLVDLYGGSAGLEKLPKSIRKARLYVRIEDGTSFWVRRKCEEALP
jgi:hypothetical protein